jgi:hypothetical protein
MVSIVFVIRPPFAVIVPFPKPPAVDVISPHVICPVPIIKFPLFVVIELATMPAENVSVAIAVSGYAFIKYNLFA